MRDNTSNPGSKMFTQDDLDRLKFPSYSQGGSLIRMLVRDLEEGMLTIPDYQRPIVWTVRQQGLFVAHCICDGACPPVVVQEWPAEAAVNGVIPPDELIDGLQRLTAYRRWLAGEIPALFEDGSEVYRSDIDPDLEGRIKNLKMTKHIVRLNTRADVLKLYLMLNRGGTPHTDAEIDRVQTLLNAELG